MEEIKFYNDCPPPLRQILIISIHLKLWIASASHSLQWVNILIKNLFN